MTEGGDKNWRGSPLDMGTGLDPYGIKEVVIEFEDGNEDSFKPKQRDEFQSYELHQMAAYLASIGGAIREGGKR